MTNIAPNKNIVRAGTLANKAMVPTKLKRQFNSKIGYLSNKRLDTSHNFNLMWTTETTKQINYSSAELIEEDMNRQQRSKLWHTQTSATWQGRQEEDNADTLQKLKPEKIELIAPLISEHHEILEGNTRLPYLTLVEYFYWMKTATALSPRWGVDQYTQ